MAVVALEKQSESLIRLENLAAVLERLTFGPSQGQLAVKRDELVRTIRTYLLPRLAQPDMPLNVVFAGPTGSGKSTLVNSLAGRILTETGPVRPTTRGAIALTSQKTAANGVAVGGLEIETVAGQAPILDTLTLIDTPDIDSTELSHRVMAEQMIDHADVVVFVTSALRYADEAPWQVLRRAVSRGSEVINVLNRVTPATGGAIVDFKTRLGLEGLEASLLTVSEHHIDSDQQRVPSLAVRALSRRLVEVGLRRDDAGRSVFARVNASVMDQAAWLAREIDQVTPRLDSFEAELDIALASRVAALTWPEDVGVVFPKSESRFAFRRWKRLANEAVSEPDAALLIATIWSDMLDWAAEDTSSMLSRDEVETAVTDTIPLIESAVERWRVGLVDVVEINPATAWTTAAREDLLGRIEVPYQHLRERLIELAQIDWECSDPQDLRACIAVAAPVDA